MRSLLSQGQCSWGWKRRETFQRVISIQSCQDAQAVTEVTQVEGAESTFLMSMQGPWLTAIEKRADLDLDFGALCQLIIGLQSLWQSGQVCGSFPDAPVYLSVTRKRVREKWYQVHKVVYNLKIEVRVWDAGWRIYILSHDLHLL